MTKTLKNHIILYKIINFVKEVEDMELKVKEFSNNKELCKFVNDNGDYIDIETIVVLNGIFQLFYWG